MAKKKSSTLLVGVLIIVAAVAAACLLLRPVSPVVLVQGGGGGVQFDSIRKHPFDVLADPYHPPERKNPYLFGRDYSYQQVGFLEGGSSMLPLFGRPHPDSSNRWEYYTMNGQIKLPVSYSGKTCNSDTGCPEMLSGGKGDPVNVLGLGSMSSYIYDTKQLRR